MGFPILVRCHLYIESGTCSISITGSLIRVEIYISHAISVFGMLISCQQITEEHMTCQSQIWWVFKRFLLWIQMFRFFLTKWNISMKTRAVTSTDFRNRLTVPPNSNRIRLTERSASPYGALCFHVFMGSDSPPGTSRLLLQVLSLLVSNQTSFTPIKRQSKIITCGVLMHKNKSLTWCHSPIVPSRINAM